MKKISNFFIILSILPGFSFLLIFGNGFIENLIDGEMTSMVYDLLLLFICLFILGFSFWANKKEKYLLSMLPAIFLIVCTMIIIVGGLEALQ